MYGCGARNMAQHHASKTVTGKRITTQSSVSVISISGEFQIYNNIPYNLENADQAKRKIEGSRRGVVLSQKKTKIYQT